MTSPTVLVPRPMSGDLRASIDEAVRVIPSGKKGQASAGVTLKGVQFDAGYKPKDWLSVGGYAGKLWSQGWDAGAKGTVTW